MIFIKTYNSFLNACNGLKTVWREERNFKIEVIITILVIGLGFYLQFSFLEFLFIVLAIVMVITAEIVNTAIEDICNKIQPDYDFDIKKIKDMMAAFVLITAIGAAAIGFIIFFPYLAYFIQVI